MTTRKPTNSRTIYVVPTQQSSGRVIMKGKRGRQFVEAETGHLPHAKAVAVTTRYIRMARRAGIIVHKMF